ncbi:MAG: HNH endonuclease [Rhizobiales bacterium]|nr:HNH endonuclease [Hyphomicrobiales bacterium]
MQINLFSYSETIKKTFTLDRVQGAPVSTDDLLSDLRRVSEVGGTNVISQKLYSELGKYAATTLSRRFGSWNKAVAAAGLEFANEINYSDARLFENIMRLWEHYGRQPRRAELALPPSVISQGAYRRRFRSWIDTLEQFIAQANVEELQAPPRSEASIGRRTSRDPSLRLRFRVLKRDNFTCRACGANPPAKPGLHLHVDHVIAWSNGGETIDENLQTLCEACNLGKSNVL